MEVPPSGGNLRVSVYNFSSQDITEGEISLLKLGLKFVPTTPIPEQDTKVDILRFSRKLLLKANFHGSEYVDDSRYLQKGRHQIWSKVLKTSISNKHKSIYFLDSTIS